MGRAKTDKFHSCWVLCTVVAAPGGIPSLLILRREEKERERGAGVCGGVIRKEREYEKKKIR